MKDKSLQAREAVKDDTVVLDSTGNVIDLNQAKLDAARQRPSSSGLRGRGWATTELRSVAGPPTGHNRT